MWATDVTINFGTTTGYWAAHNDATYTDSDSRTWTRVCSVSNMSGQAGYSQFGNTSNTPTATLTATAGSDITVTAFSVTMSGASGGNSPTTGTIYLYKKSGKTETELATASVNGTTAVTCSITSSQAFSSTDELEVKYVGTTKAVRVTQLSYSYTTSGGGGGGSSVSAPTFSPAAGAVAAGSTITLSHADADAIRYTTDGTNPTKTTGTVYSAPITITTATTIKAIAIKGENVSSVASASYTITVATPTFSLEGGSYLEGTSVTLTSAGNTIYYTTDGSTPNNTSTECTGSIAIAAGKKTYKAIAYDTYGNASGVITRTYTGITPTSLPFSWTGTSDNGKENLAAQTGVVVNLSSDYAASNAPYRLKYDGTSKYVMIFTNEKPEVVSFTAKLFEAANTGSKMKVQASADGIDFTDIEEFTIKGAANATFEFTTSNAFASTDRVVKIALSSKDKNVGVGTISISAISYTMNAYEWSTFVSDKALDFTGSGVKAYGVTGHSGNALTLTSELTTVAANTPLLLNATEGEHIIKVVASGGDVDGNLLKAGTGAISKEDGKTKYVLGIEGGKATFLKIDDVSATVPTDKAYLEFNEEINAPVLSFDGEGTTGISTLNVERGTLNDNSYYMLDGRRVAQPTKGLYIVNGKKVIIK